VYGGGPWLVRQYEEPYDTTRPKVKCDATSQQLMAETRVPLPSKPGRPARYDYEYQHNWTCNLLLFCPPQVGWWPIVAPAQRPMEDLVEYMHWLVDIRYPETEKS
jgi:hypothetical protein